MNTRAIFSLSFNAKAPMQVDEVNVVWCEDKNPDLSYLLR